MNAIFTFFLNWLWGKVVPATVEFFKRLAKKREIKREVDEETSAINQVRKEIEEWRKEHPEDDVPPHLEKRMRELARARARGL